MPVLKVALTGSIGSGKSTALELFARAGARVISTDAIAHELMQPGKPAAAAIRRRFGTLDRRALADRVFASRSERKALEKLLHPRIMAEVDRRAQGSGGVVVVEVPLLFEAKLEKRFDVLVAVDAPDAVRMKRTLARGLSRAEALKRVKAQLPAAEKARRADVVLDNSGSKAKLKQSVDSLYRAFALIADASKKRGDK